MGRTIGAHTVDDTGRLGARAISTGMPLREEQAEER
jgi:hypothetical protein